MSQMPIIQTSPNAPALPQELLGILSQEADRASAALSSGAFNILRFKRNLELTIDGTKEEIEYGKFAAVLITSAEFNHALWYKQQYRAGALDAPDLVWHMTAPDKFPDALPEMYRKKIGTGKDSHWGFQIRRRTIWVRVTKEGIAFDNPFVIDIPSTLLYGKSDKQGAYTWKDIIALCKTESMRGVPIYPGMFVNRFIAHTSPQQGLFYFQPVCDTNGYLKYLDVDSIRAVLNMAQDPEIRSMVVIKEKLTYGDEAQPQPQPQPQRPVNQPQPQQPQPQPQQPQPQQPTHNQNVQVQSQAAQPQSSAQPNAQPQQAQSQAPQAQPAQAQIMNEAQNAINNLSNIAQQNIAANNEAPIGQDVLSYVGNLL